VLSADERARADQFRFDRDRRRFIAARRGLRVILGRLLSAEPDLLVFAYSASGKPALGGKWATRGIEFNLSHSHGLALIAVCRSRTLGVDLEHVRALPDMSDIVERFFSSNEQAAFSQLAATEKTEAFFRGWVRKEALLKAKGTGMSVPLASFDVSLRPGEPAKLLHFNGLPKEADRWSLVDLDPAPEFVGALAVEGGDRRLVRHELRP
jgi:4'-phosphopantetheinyl transferase